LRRRALTLALSEPDTSFCSSRRRLRLAFFLPRMWLRIAWRPRILPRGLTLKRFFAPECVFIFGIEATIEAEELRVSADKRGRGGHGPLPTTQEDPR